MFEFDFEVRLSAGCWSAREVREAGSFCLCLRAPLPLPLPWLSVVALGAAVVVDIKNVHCALLRIAHCTAGVGCWVSFAFLLGRLVYCTAGFRDFRDFKNDFKFKSRPIAIAQDREIEMCNFFKCPFRTRQSAVGTTRHSTHI